MSFETILYAVADGIATITLNRADVGNAMNPLQIDIRVASEKARVGFVYAHRRIVFECGSSWFLPRVVGISKALECSFSGRVIPEQELKGGGLVSHIVAPEQLLAKAYAIADNTAPSALAGAALTRRRASNRSWKSGCQIFPALSPRICLITSLGGKSRSTTEPWRVRQEECERY